MSISPVGEYLPGLYVTLAPDAVGRPGFRSVIVCECFKFIVLIRAQYRRGPEEMVKRILLLIALGAVVFSFLGCKTVQGIGGDITWLGKKGEQAIQR